MSWEAQDLLAVQKIFDVDLVPSTCGEEFYFIPKQGWTDETWQAGTNAFCKITEVSLEQYDSSVGPIYRPTKITDKIIPLIEFIAKLAKKPIETWSKESIAEKVKEIQKEAERAEKVQRQEVEMYGDGKVDVLNGFAGTMVIQPWFEQDSFCVMMQNVENTDDEMVQILSHYSQEGIQKNPTEQGTVYYPTNPQDEKFLKFLADVSGAQQQITAQMLVSQSQLKPGQRQLRTGAAADQTPLAHMNAMHRTGKTAAGGVPFKTGASNQGATHMVAGRVIKGSVFDSVPSARIGHDGKLIS